MSKTEKDVVVVISPENMEKIARLLEKRLDHKPIEVRDAGDGTYEVRTSECALLSRRTDPLAWGGMVMIALRASTAQLLSVRCERDEEQLSWDHLVAVVRFRP
jgi:hypothetical protein